MEILYLLIPLSLIIIAFAVFAFFWAVNNKQFDDLDSPAYMILFDDNLPSSNADKEISENSQQSNVDKTNENASASKDN